MKFNWANVDYKKLGLLLAGGLISILSDAIKREKDTELIRKMVQEELEKLKKGEKK